MKYAISFGLILAACLLFLLSLPAKRGSAEEETARETVYRLMREADSLDGEYQSDSATVLARHAVEKARNWLGETDTTYFSALSLLGFLTCGYGALALSDSALTKALVLGEEIYGREHPKIADVLYRLAFLRSAQGDQAQAARILRRVVDIQIRTYGQNSQEVVGILVDLSEILWRDKRFDEADSLLKKAENIYRDIYGPLYPSIATTLYKRGDRYRILGRFIEAEKCLLQSLAILDALPDASPGIFVGVLNALGKTYTTLARYEEAESYLKRGRDIVRTREKEIRAENAAVLINSLGNLCKVQGKYEEAEEAYEQSLQIRLERIGPNWIHIAEPLNNLGDLSLLLGKYPEAEKHFLRALKAREGWYGSNHEILVYSLNGLGRVYLQQGKYSEADSMFRWALRNVEKAFGTHHLHVAWCLEALGNLHRAQGKYSQAESLYTRALEIREGCLGPNHPEIAASLKNLAILYGTMGDFDKSETNYKRMQRLRYNFIQNVFSYASEAQKMRYVSSYPLVDHSFLSLAILDSSSSDAVGSALKMVLQGKAIVIDAVMAEKEAACCSFDDEIVKTYEEHTDICNLIASMALADVTNFPKQTYRNSMQILHDVKDSLETELSQRCSEFRDELAARRFSLPEIADALPEEAVLWEFVRYEPYDFVKVRSEKEKTDPPRYLAFALTHSGVVTLVDLGDASEIDGLVGLARKMIYDSGPKVHSPMVVVLEQQLREVTGKLYDMIFAPLKPTLAGRREILISPDGQLSLLPFEILPHPDGKYVIEGFNVSYLSSGRDLLRFERERDFSERALVIADPDFDLSPTALSKHAARNVKRSDASSFVWAPARGVSGCLDTRFNPLRYSRRESEAVTKTLNKEGNLKVNAYYGGDAIEEVLKGITSPPRVLHLATHGYFCEDLEVSGNRLLENPLLRSGLALAGANRLMGQREIDRPPTEDGILTAFEVSGLNLVGTELVVLSACETGIGDVKNGEGVFGLRRAFQHAGARAVLMSLWKVPDKETCELMDHFYSRWLEGWSKKTALHKSILKIIKAHQQKSGVAHPYFWGAFVLAGDPR